MVHKDYTNSVFGWGRSERSIEECGVCMSLSRIPLFSIPQISGRDSEFRRPFFSLILILILLFLSMFSQNYNFILNLTRSNILSNSNQVLL